MRDPAETIITAPDARRRISDAALALIDAAIELSPPGLAQSGEEAPGAALSVAVQALFMADLMDADAPEPMQPGSMTTAAIAHRAGYMGHGLGQCAGTFGQSHGASCFVASLIEGFNEGFDCRQRQIESLKR